MNRSSLLLLVLSVFAMTSLSACSSVPSRGRTSGSSICQVPAQCLRMCGPMPAPTGKSEPELMRWEMQMVQWGERCTLVNDDCVSAVRAFEK